MPYNCPVCAYDNMVKPPVNFTICPSCGTEFGYDDAGRSYDQLRAEWTNNGAHWFSQATQPPQGWNGYRQLLRAGFPLISPAQHADRTDETFVRVAGFGLRMSASAA